MLTQDLAAFAALAVVLAVTPGADTIVVLGNAASGGTRCGLATTVGVKTGTVVHAVLAGFGVAAVLMQFAAFYEALRMVGATYLVVLGALGVFKALTEERTRETRRPEAPKPLARCFVEGFLSNLLNPKVILFYVAVLPQFVTIENVSQATARLAGIHIGASLAWLCLVSFFVGSARKWLTRPAVRRAVGVASGLAIAAFGVRLALSRR